MFKYVFVWWLVRLLVRDPFLIGIFTYYVEVAHSEDQGVDGRMGSEWILDRLAGVCGLDSTGSG
jgi:hypothetical protein